MVLILMMAPISPVAALKYFNGNVNILTVNNAPTETIFARVYGVHELI